MSEEPGHLPRTDCATELWRPTSLWRHADFLRLWTGTSVSLVGTAVTELALPLVAVLILRAGPVQMGILGALQLLPYLLVSLPAGVWVDRMRRRPLMVGCDLGRAALLVSIPAAAILGRLSMFQLYSVGFLVGILNVYFGVAYQAFLPPLVGRENLVEGNTKLGASAAGARIIGQGIGGTLVQVLTAPVTIVLDALAYLVHTLGVRPAAIGGIFAFGAISGFAGAALSRRAAAVLGVGPSIWVAFVVIFVGGVCLILASLLRPATLPLLLVSRSLSGLGLTSAGINQTSLRQSVTPADMQGRVGAGFAFSTSGIRPVGMVLGGFLGQTIGLRPTMMAGVFAVLLIALALLASPVRTVRTLAHP